MPFVDLNSPTGLALQWGWLLVTRANALVYLLLVVVFVLGITVRLPRSRKERAAEAAMAARGAGGDAGASAGEAA